ncbi:MAG: hypothetical protein ACX932_04180 [Gammaproteobacteria bacterium]
MYVILDIDTLITAKANGSGEVNNKLLELLQVLKDLGITQVDMVTNCCLDETSRDFAAKLLKKVYNVDRSIHYFHRPDVNKVVAQAFEKIPEGSLTFFIKVVDTECISGSVPPWLREQNLNATQLIINCSSDGSKNSEDNPVETVLRRVIKQINNKNSSSIVNPSIHTILEPIIDCYKGSKLKDSKLLITNLKSFDIFNCLTGWLDNLPLDDLSTDTAQLIGPIIINILSSLVNLQMLLDEKPELDNDKKTFSSKIFNLFTSALESMSILVCRKEALSVLQREQIQAFIRTVMSYIFGLYEGCNQQKSSFTSKVSQQKLSCDLNVFSTLLSYLNSMVIDTINVELNKAVMDNILRPIINLYMDMGDDINASPKDQKALLLLSNTFANIADCLENMNVCGELKDVRKNLNEIYVALNKAANSAECCQASFLKRFFLRLAGFVMALPTLGLAYTNRTYRSKFWHCHSERGREIYKISYATKKIHKQVDKTSVALKPA